MTAKKKLTAKEPSMKQTKAIEYALENGGNISQAMLKAGYSPATAKTPQKLTQSQAFQRAMEKAGISEAKLAERLNEGLDATKAVVMGKESSDSFVDVQPDFAIRHKYIETAIKLKGIDKQADTPNGTFIQINNNLKDEYAD